jgi:hypothetical protein
MGYSVDGQANVTVTGNTTLPTLPKGSHELIVYANDTYGNMGSSEKINFTITLVKETEQVPITLTAGAAALLIIIITGIIIYILKRKH